MKRFLHLSLCLLFAACNTTETFDSKGRVTSRTKSPSPETWTVTGEAVSTFGAVAVSSWAQQMANQQRWEKGEK